MGGKASAAKQPRNRRRGKADHLKAWQYPKGVSGNTKGRPPKRPLTEGLQDAIANDPELLGKLVEALILGALRGEPAHMREVWQRSDGFVHRGEHVELPSMEITLQNVLVGGVQAAGTPPRQVSTRTVETVRAKVRPPEMRVSLGPEDEDDSDGDG